MVSVEMQLHTSANTKRQWQLSDVFLSWVTLSMPFAVHMHVPSLEITWHWQLVRLFCEDCSLLHLYKQQLTCRLHLIEPLSNKALCMLPPLPPPCYHSCNTILKYLPTITRSIYIQSLYSNIMIQCKSNDTTNGLEIVKSVLTPEGGLENRF